MHTFLSFIIVLGLLIFVHEFGHFILAKLFGVKVFRFSLGFGPRLVGKTVGDTEYVISGLPLGGYVKMLGEAPGEEIPEDDLARSFANKPVWARFLIVAGGPVFNLLFAVVVYFLIFSLVGEPVVGTRIGEVQPDSAAAAAGLEAGDEIVAIDGEQTDRWAVVSERIRESEGRPVALTVRRGEELLRITAQPEMKEVKNLFNEDIRMPVLGITASADVTIEPVGLAAAFRKSFEQTWEVIYLTIMTLVKIVQHVVPASTLGGPIFIAQMAGQQLQAGWVNLFYFIGLLSVNLGVLNLLPIPILDGGHLVFFSVEAIMRRPLSVKTREILQQIGLVILISLMFFVFYNDISRIFFKG